MWLNIVWKHYYWHQPHWELIGTQLQTHVSDSLAFSVWHSQVNMFLAHEPSSLHRSQVRWKLKTQEKNIHKPQHVSECKLWIQPEDLTFCRAKTDLHVRSYLRHTDNDQWVRNRSHIHISLLLNVISTEFSHIFWIRAAFISCWNKTVRICYGIK